MLRSSDSLERWRSLSSIGKCKFFFTAHIALSAISSRLRALAEYVAIGITFYIMSQPREEGQEKLKVREANQKLKDSAHWRVTIPSTSARPY